MNTVGHQKPVSGIKDKLGSYFIDVVSVSKRKKRHIVGKWNIVQPWEKSCFRGIFDDIGIFKNIE